MPEDGGKERHLDASEGAGIKCLMFESPLFYSLFLILKGGWWELCSLTFVFALNFFSNLNVSWKC